MDMVKQLLHRAPKRRKVLVQFLISNTHSCDEQLRMTASTFLKSEQFCCQFVVFTETKRFREGAVLPFPCSANLSVVFQVNLQMFLSVVVVVFLVL